MKKILFLLLLVFTINNLYAADITVYVSPFGDDETAEANNPNKPFKSPVNAYNSIKNENTTSFDTVVLMEGEYYTTHENGLFQQVLNRNGIAITGADRRLTKIFGNGINNLISLPANPTNKGTPALSTQYGQQISRIGFYNANAAIYKAAATSNNTLGFWENYFDTSLSFSLYQTSRSYQNSYLISKNIFNNAPIYHIRNQNFSIPAYSSYNLFMNNTIVGRIGTEIPTSSYNTFINDNIFYDKNGTNIFAFSATWRLKNNRFYSISQINNGNTVENIGNIFDTSYPFIEDVGFTLKPTDPAVNAGSNNKTIGATEVGVVNNLDTWLIYDYVNAETLPAGQSKVMYIDSQNRMRFWDTMPVLTHAIIYTEVFERHSNPASYWIKFPVHFKGEYWNDSGYRTKLSNDKNDTVSTIILIGSDNYNDIYNLNLSNCYVDYNYINGSEITDTTMRRKRYMRAILKFNFDV